MAGFWANQGSSALTRINAIWDSGDYDETTETWNGSLPLLDSVSYDPTNQQTFNTTSATLVDVDSTNLAPSFTVPTSANVLIVVLAAARQQTSGYVQLGFRDGTSAVTGSKRTMTNARSNIERQVYEVVFDPDTLGWTREATKTLKLAAASSDGAGTAQVFYGNGDGAGTGDPIGPVDIYVYQVA